MRFLIIFVLLITNTLANEVADIKNLIINKELKKYSDLTFFDAFNNQLSLSPAAFFNRLRLKSAERLLKDTNLSVQEIGLRTGYSSSASFSRSFKKFSGKSPISFRYSMVN